MLFWCLPVFTIGQNLILNGNFEKYSFCPNNVGEIEKSIHWVSLNSGTPDFFHQNCSFADSAGTIENGSLGLIICCDYEDAVEYFGQSLSQPLEAGEYNLKFKIKPRKGPFYSNNFGVILRKGKVKLNHWGPFIDQPNFNIDTPITQTDKWTSYEVKLFAKGGEDFIAFGNFSSPENNELIIDKTQKISIGWQTYLYIDDISLESLVPVQAQNINYNLEFIPPIIYFDFDQFVLKQEYKDSIKSYVENLSAIPNATLTLKGFTDSDGSTAYNYKLAGNRINAVKTYLVSLNKKLSFVEEAFGEENPKYSNSNAISKHKNRRVEIIFSKP